VTGRERSWFRHRRAIRSDPIRSDSIRFDSIRESSRFTPIHRRDMYTFSPARDVKSEASTTSSKMWWEGSEAQPVSSSVDCFVRRSRSMSGDSEASFALSDTASQVSGITQDEMKGEYSLVSSPVETREATGWSDPSTKIPVLDESRGSHSFRPAKPPIVRVQVVQIKRKESEEHTKTLRPPPGRPAPWQRFCAAVHATAQDTWIVSAMESETILRIYSLRNG